MYQQCKKINHFGIDGYKVEKKYETTRQALKDKNIEESKNEKKK